MARYFLKKKWVILFFFMISFSLFLEPAKAQDSTLDFLNDIESNLDHISNNSNNLVSSGNSIKDSFEEIKSLSKESNELLSKLVLASQSYNLSGVFLAIATILAGLLAVLFAIGSIHLSNVEQKFNIKLEKAHRLIAGLYSWIGYGIAINLCLGFLAFVKNTAWQMLFFIGDIIFVAIILGYIWNLFTKIINSTNLEAAMNLKFKEIINNESSANLLYPLIDYSIKNDITYYPMGMSLLVKLINSSEDIKIKRKLVSDFLNFFFRVEEPYFNEAYGSFTDLIRSLTESLLNAIESGKGLGHDHNLELLQAGISKNGSKLAKLGDFERGVSCLRLLQHQNIYNVKLAIKNSFGDYLIKRNVDLFIEVVLDFKDSLGGISNRELFFILSIFNTYLEQLLDLSKDTIFQDRKEGISDLQNKILINYLQFREEVINSSRGDTETLEKIKEIRKMVGEISEDYLTDEKISENLKKLRKKCGL